MASLFPGFAPISYVTYKKNKQKRNIVEGSSNIVPGFQTNKNCTRNMFWFVRIWECVGPVGGVWEILILLEF